MLQDALSELYSAAPSPAVPKLAAPPLGMFLSGSAGLNPHGLGTMRLSEETAGALASSEIWLMDAESSHWMSMWNTCFLDERLMEGSTIALHQRYWTLASVQAVLGLPRPRCLAGLFPSSSAGASLPMMLNGVLAQGQAPGIQQPQQQAVSGPGLSERQQQQGGDAAAMDVDDSDSVQPPAGKLAHAAQSIQLSSMYSRMPSPSHRLVSRAGHADALLELDLYLNNRDS